MIERFDYTRDHQSPPKRWLLIVALAVAGLSTYQRVHPVATTLIAPMFSEMRACSAGDIVAWEDQFGRFVCARGEGVQVKVTR